MKMRCVFLDIEGRCLASPPIKELLRVFTPEIDVVKEYCETENFGKCPRLVSTLDYLRAQNGKS